MDFVLVGVVARRQVALGHSGPVALEHSGPVAPQWHSDGQMLDALRKLDGSLARLGEAAEVLVDALSGGAPSLHPWEVHMVDGEVLGAIRGGGGGLLTYFRAPTEKAYRDHAVWGQP